MSSAGGGGAQPTPPRKGAFSKQIHNLHKDQFAKLQAKNNQEVHLLDNIRTFVKHKAALDKHYAESLLKLTSTHLSNRMAEVPDVQSGIENREDIDVNVFNIWRHVLQENEKMAKARLATIQVFHDEVEKDAKNASKAKQANTKISFEQLATIQKDLQITVAELDRTKRLYFEEETGALETRDKAKDAEERAKGKKKDLKSLFSAKATLKKHAGMLSAKQEEQDIRSTGARNDYILSLASANAHQERYFGHDLQDIMRSLEGENFYERVKKYLDTITKTEFTTCYEFAESLGKIQREVGTVAPKYNNECFSKLYPSLAQQILYEHEAAPGDETRTITPSEHDGGYSLNYEARQNASKLNQSVKTIKAYNKRIQACYFHKSKGLKKEPNDTAGPDLDTKIRELKVAIRNAEIERAKAEARLAKLREGGIAVDEFIDAFVVTYEAEEKQQQNQENAMQNEAAATEWPTESAESNNVVAAEVQAQAEEPTEWNDNEPMEEAQPTTDAQENWATWDSAQRNDQHRNEAEQDWADAWASADQAIKQQDQQDAEAPGEASREVRAVVLYNFEAQNEDELNIMENEELNILLDECDEEGWLKAVNADGKVGYIPQNYVDMGQGAEGAEAGVGAGEYDQQNSYGRQDSYGQGSYGRQESFGRQDSYGQGSYGRQDSYNRQESFGRQDSYNRQESFGRQESVVSGQDSYSRQDSYGYGYGQYQYSHDRKDSYSSSAGYGRQDSVVSSQYGDFQRQDSVQQGYHGVMQSIPEAPPVPQVPPPVVDDEEEESSSAEEDTESMAPPPPNLPPPPARPPDLPDENSSSKADRPPSISISASIDSKNQEFCRALYDYEATGSDEISFEEGDVIRVLKRCPNGVDDGWWLGEISGKTGLFPSIVVEECSDEEGETPDASSMTSPPSMGPPSIAPPVTAPPPPPPVVQERPPPPPPVPPHHPKEPDAASEQAKEPAEVRETSDLEESADADEETRENEELVKIQNAPDDGRTRQLNKMISITAASPIQDDPKDIVQKENELEGENKNCVTKPTVPCVQVSIDEVPEIPLDEVAVKTETKPAPGGLDAMEINVIAPTPKVQSPDEDEDSFSLPTYPDTNAQGETCSGEQIQKTEEAEPVKEMKEASEAENKKEEQEQEVDEKHEEKDKVIATDEMPKEGSGASEAARRTSEAEQSIGKTDATDQCPVIERHSSADSPLSSPDDSSSSQVLQKKRMKEEPSGHISSSSGSEEEGADAPSISEATESDLPVPPDQLELRHLKKLDSMKESTA